MPNKDQRQTLRRRKVLPDSADDSDSIVELSLKLAAAARKRSPKTWPVAHLLADEE